MAAMKLRKSIAAFTLSLILALPSAARAASSNDDETITNDARTEGYTTNVQLPKNGSAGTWVIFTIVAIVAVGVMFKDPKRTHLD